ncbi:uncharacterized protein LOC142230930 [Haematobia irritans]|uniref:uncharacterized protein LOC142230930 n=1 Tax=Haematobia irritans TaxID=7368 RepID=UPI003F50378E
MLQKCVRGASKYIYDIVTGDDYHHHGSMSCHTPATTFLSTQKIDLMDILSKKVTAVAVALPQTQTTASLGGATVAFVENFQFDAFDTTRTTFASSSLSSSSASLSSFEEAGGTQMSSFPTSLATSLGPFSSMTSSSSSSSSAAAAAYPTLVSTTSTGYHNFKTSRIMSSLNSISSSIHPISPTYGTPTAHGLHTTFRGSTASSRGSTRSKFMGTQQTSTATLGLGSTSALPSFKNFMKNTNTHSGGGGVKQEYPLDFTFSKNHWTNSDAAFIDGGGTVGVGNGGESIGSITGNVGVPAVASASATGRLGSSLSSETERPRIFRNRHHHEQHWGPFFEQPLNSTTSGDNSITTAHLYTEAVLNCRVGMLKDKTGRLQNDFEYSNKVDTTDE